MYSFKSVFFHVAVRNVFGYGRQLPLPAVHRNALLPNVQEDVALGPVIHNKPVCIGPLTQVATPAPGPTEHKVASPDPAKHCP